VFKIEKDGTLLDFSYETLLISLYEALRHKESAAVDAQYVCQTVVDSLQQQKNAVIPSSTIAHTACDILHRFDRLSGDIYKALHNGYFSDS
jgi:transcriptional regulator NrdR family protein